MAAGVNRIVVGTSRSAALNFPFLWGGNLLQKNTKLVPPRYRSAKKTKMMIAVSLGAAVFFPEKNQFWKPSMHDHKNNHIPIFDDARSSLLSDMSKLYHSFFGPWRNCWRPALEILFENGIVRCQSFTLIAVAGSFIGSILCFVEGCVFVMKSSIEYLGVISQRVVDQGQIVKLLIEAIDMFLVGTALLTFGMSLYIMFVGSNEMEQGAESNFGSFNLKKLKQGMEMQSIMEAKSKIGHVVLLLLQAGMLEKFKSVALTSTVDLACFAAALLASSASVFLLSHLTHLNPKPKTAPPTEQQHCLINILYI